jgi:hypothetical protein
MSDIVETTAPNAGGRPKIARGVATSSPEAGPAWSIRGVPANVRALANKAATARGATVGDWVSEAIVRHARPQLERMLEENGDPELLERLRASDQTPVTSDSQAVAIVPPPPAAEDLAPSIGLDLVAAIERQTRALERQAREARRDRWRRRR